MKIVKTVHVYVTKQEAEIIGNFCALLDEMDPETWSALDDAMLGDLGMLAEKADDLNDLVEYEEE
jgi:3-methyladenine DNA glycosylase/8-oxoguanine DNA glycosylase